MHACTETEEGKPASTTAADSSQAIAHADPQQAKEWFVHGADHVMSQKSGPPKPLKRETPYFRKM
eukprot:4663183-Amphidinium_carterae.1